MPACAANAPGSSLGFWRRSVGMARGVAPEFKASLTNLSSELLGGTPHDFTNLLKADISQWEPIVKSLGLRND